MCRNTIEHHLIACGWHVHNQTAHRQFSFVDFEHAWRFMAEVAAYATRVNHHPDWRNVYGEVWISLTTHDAFGLTELDVDFANYCDVLYESSIEE